MTSDKMKRKMRNVLEGLVGLCTNFKEGLRKGQRCHKIGCREEQWDALQRREDTNFQSVHLQG